MLATILPRLANPSTCHLRAGGVATSASVFNRFRLKVYHTGSYWTLQLYDPNN